MQRSLVLLLALTSIAAFGCTAANTLAIAVTPVPMSVGQGSRVDVTLTNSGRRPVPKAVLRCQFYDATDQKLQTGLAYFSGLKPGASATEPILAPNRTVARGACAVDRKRR